MLKIFQARLQQNVKREIPEYKLDLEKAEKPDISFKIHWIIEKTREFQKKKKEKNLLLLHWLC